MKITVDLRSVQALKAQLAGLGKQIPYAASRALNATGQAVADAMPAEMEKALDRPTPFTKRGVRVLRYANKGRLETVVGFMDAQAKYMAEDRARLLDVIKENTEIIQKNTEAFEDLREVLIRTGGKS